MENYVIPVVGLILIVAIDQRVSSVLLTPMLSICLLGVLAFRLETKMLTFWFGIIAINVILALAENRGMRHGAEMNLQTVAARSFGFVVAGSIAVFMNNGRSHLARNHRHLLRVLERLPCAVAVSDSSGTIVFSNKRALHLLKKDASDVIGLSYFSFFTSPEHRGHDIQAYLRLSEEMTTQETWLTLMTDAEHRRDVPATQIPMRLSGQKCVVTCIDTDPSAHNLHDALEL